MTHDTVPASEACAELLTRLDRIAAAGETLRATVAHNGGTTSPSVPALLRDLERDLTIAARDIARVRESVRR
jgi:hypothetical protein